MRPKIDFVWPLKLIWAVQPRDEKYLTSVYQKFVVLFCIPPGQEGRFAIVTNVGAGCDGRWLHQPTSDAAFGRRKRVVLASRC
jgi:hypothetical protein